MSKHKTLITAFAVATLIFSTSSCKKETPEINKNSNVSFEESKKIAKQLFAMAMPTGSTSFAFKNGAFDCVAVSVDSTSGYVKTFDYGQGCADDQGIVRRGIITATCNSENIQTPGTLMMLTFNNFFVNEDEVTGYMSIENIGANGNGNLVIRFITDCQDHSAINGLTQLDAAQYFEWTAGGNTSAYDDDEFSVSGSFAATAPNNRMYSVTINQPLITKTAQGCNEFFVQGTTLNQTTGEDDRYIDYGNGTCDNLATETVNGVSGEIVLE